MKERLDVMMVNRGLAESREKAKAIIMSGIVYVDNIKEDKAGSTFDEKAQIEVRGNTLKYVSRGGLKLEKAMDCFGVSLAGKWKLRNDERVVCMEKTNIRYVTPDDIEDRIEFASIDVSFISLTKVLPPVKELLTDDGEIVCLIKPQFEAGREKVGKKGVVRDQKVHVEVVEMIVDFARQIGFKTLDLSYSPIKGPEGNIEYLLYITKDQTKENKEFDIKAMVEESHRSL